MLAELSLGHVGLVLGTEMSRLARSCKDWFVDDDVVDASHRSHDEVEVEQQPSLWRAAS